MTDTKRHTPGPWRHQKDFGTIFTTTDPKNGVGLTVAIARVQSDQVAGGFDEAKANARLIAAAPDLLAALKEAVGGIVYLAEEANCNTAEWIEWHKRARAAIAEVEGDET